MLAITVRMDLAVSDDKDLAFAIYAPLAFCHGGLSLKKKHETIKLGGELR